MNLEHDVASHYGRSDLKAAVSDALRRAGKDLERLTLDDLAPIDEFHIRGLEATLELGRDLGLAPGQRVLDVGSSLGPRRRRRRRVHPRLAHVAHSWLWLMRRRRGACHAPLHRAAGFRYPFAAQRTGIETWRRLHSSAWASWAIPWPDM